VGTFLSESTKHLSCRGDEKKLRGHSIHVWLPATGAIVLPEHCTHALDIKLGVNPIEQFLQIWIKI